MERKTSPAFITKTDDELGIVETVFAVFGNLDLGNDIIHPGAFAKTFVERGHKVKLLDHHNTFSVLDVLGKPLSFRELTADELPTDLLKEYPEATGGAWAQVQFNMKTQAGHDAFQHFRAGDIDEWSFGYDALDKDFAEIDKVEVRNLRTIKLYELSPVIWGMNPATTTTSAKDQKPEPEETEETIRIRVKEPGGFQEDSFRTISIDKDRGIQAVIGRLEGETTTTIQAYIFSKDKEDWTIVTAQAWVDEHKSLEPKALTFAEALSRERQERNLSDQRWKMESALSNAVLSIARDVTLDSDAKRQALQDSFTQYGTAMVAWFAEALDADYFAAEDGVLKGGRVLFVRNEERIDPVNKGLIEALRMRGIDIVGTSEVGPDGDTTHPAKGAGPDDAPSTNADLLKVIEIKQKQITLMEV